jgi:hypothetical protein
MVEKISTTFFYFSVNLNKILCFIHIKKINSTKCLLQSRLALTNNVQKNIYIYSKFALLKREMENW